MSFAIDPEPDPEDDVDRRTLARIRDHGWQVMAVEADDEGPGFAYSVGLVRTFGHPEILTIGLDVRVLMGMINAVSELVRAGKRFDHLDESGDVLEAYNVAFRKVEPRHFRDFVGYARWYYRADEFPLLQCVWPDARGRFPWHADFPVELASRQPVLSDDRCWPFQAGKNVAYFTTRHVLAGAAVLLVSHDEEGDWQFLCGTTNDPSDGALVCLGDMLARDSSLAEVADLPEGWMAERQAPGTDWSRSRSDRRD
ncbi:hypothetical protein OJF2_61570 [Aquisphaera giovannonii]|uniref:DUF4262 domain-containing protein n=1 Tax=Aquisphaera giovannonii TaxID=406548 RepID=A0A5B9WAI3_9BACT|nr:DUF4262 domain-containing protein [Aquisphaera giovannonii]QEH37566.1 hypothetical protein OJF2_61570 [Aquisphaera giovannonii]